MKNIKTLEIRNTSSVSCYNDMESATSTSFEEAVRTLEAIENVRSHPFLVKRIKEEVEYEATRE